MEDKGAYAYSGYLDLRVLETMSSTALSVSVTRSEASYHLEGQRFFKTTAISQTLTILLRVYHARVCGSDHVSGFESDFEERIVDLL